MTHSGPGAASSWGRRSAHSWRSRCCHCRRPGRRTACRPRTLCSPSRRWPAPSRAARRQRASATTHLSRTGAQSPSLDNVQITKHFFAIIVSGKDLRGWGSSPNSSLDLSRSISPALGNDRVTGQWWPKVEIGQQKSSKCILEDLRWCIRTCLRKGLTIPWSCLRGSSSFLQKVVHILRWNAARECETLLNLGTMAYFPFHKLHFTININLPLGPLFIIYMYFWALKTKFVFWLINISRFKFLNGRPLM